MENLGVVAIRGRGKGSPVDDRIGIEVYKYVDGSYELSEEYKFDPYDGSGVNVIPAAADLDGDGYDELIYSTEFWVGDPHPENSELGILKFDGENFELVKSYEINLRGMLFASQKVGDVDNDGRYEIVVPAYANPTETPTPVLYIINPRF